MNLDNLKPGWQKQKVLHGLHDIEEAEILSIIEPEYISKPFWSLSKRAAQNTLIFTFLLLCLNGGCAV